MAKRASTSSRNPTLDASSRVVILHGKERFLQGLYTDVLRAALVEAHGGPDGIDTLRFDGATATPADVLDECRSFGLMQQHKLVIVDNADLFVKTGDVKPARGHVTARQALETYAEAPSDGATLLLRAETWRPGKLDKAVANVGAAIKCEQPNAREAVGWARARCEQAYGVKIQPQGANLLIEHLGSDLGRIDSELAKLATAKAGDGSSGANANAIGVDDVRALVGYSREEEFWSIQAALLSGDPAKALAQLRDLLEVSRHDPVAITWSYTDLARKLHGASRMLAGGASPGMVSKELRLWGGADTLIRCARALTPERARELFDAAVRADAAQKTGLGDPVRTLECLTVRFTTPA